MWGRTHCQCSSECWVAVKPDSTVGSGRWSKSSDCPKDFSGRMLCHRTGTKTRALVSFQTLGPRAAPAADRIVRFLNDPDTALCAIVAIMLIQPAREDQILSLTNVVRLRRADRTGASPDLLFSTALLALGSFGPRASNAIPFLIGSLGSTNERVQATAAVALARVGAPAETVVPLIVNTLPNTGPTPRPGTRPIFPPRGSGVSEVMMKLWALEQFGPGLGLHCRCFPRSNNIAPGIFRRQQRELRPRLEGKNICPLRQVLEFPTSFVAPTRAEQERPRHRDWQQMKSSVMRRVFA